ncbi:MAG: PTS transporter subunit EIIC [Clostridia bacterium]|nr:PTS transporter subunit EIIC [Clostridia bacterium]
MRKRNGRVLAPMSGVAQPLEAVGDEVFARGVLGAGVAIRPSSGRVVSPVDGVVSSVAATKHAYGFTAEDGTQVLVHIGLETVGLDGEGFRALVAQGQRVKAGDAVAEVDLALLEARGLDAVTPVIVLEGAAEACATGRVTAGRDVLLRVPGSAVAPAPEQPRRRGGFDFLQRLGKTLMTVIAVMPAAGLALSVGKLLQMPGIALLTGVGVMLEQIGWAVIGNLHLLFAAAIGGNWARERAGGAFAAVVSFVLINAITGAIFGVSSDMLATEGATVRSLLGQELAVGDYFTQVLGRPALNMGVFVGMVAGFLGAAAYNRFYNFRRLPQALAFFGGKRFVPLVVMAYSLIASVVLAVVWPLVQAGVNAFGVWIATSQEVSPVLAPFLYGTLERLLLPFGLHHMLTIPMNYTAFGGEYVIRTGAAAGTVVYGQDPLWLAWVTDLMALRQAGDAPGAAQLMAQVVPGQFKVGQMIGSLGLLPGVALGMYRRIPRERRAACRSMFLSAALAVLLTGVTEPVEFMFMFAAWPLYIVYALLQGCAFALAGVVDLRLHAFGGIELLSRIPMSLSAGLAGDLINFLLACGAFAAIGFGVAYFMVGRFRFATPGQPGSDVHSESQAGGEAQGNARAERIIALLGGRENIVVVDACMTRLRVTVKDASLVGDAQGWRGVGAVGLIVRGTGVQAVFGPEADGVRADVDDALRAGAAD